MQLDGVHSQPVVAPITDFIKSRLANQFRRGERAEQIRLYKYFAKVPDSKATASIFFEAVGSISSAGSGEPDHDSYQTIEYSDDGPSWITSGAFYIPGTTNRMALDSFILFNGILYIFQFTIDTTSNLGLLTSSENSQASHLWTIGVSSSSDPIRH